MKKNINNIMNEKKYERVNWQARKTPLSAANLNRMDEGIENNFINLSHVTDTK